MSERELGRVEVLARVKSGELRVVDAAVLLRLSYRQTKRLRKRYGEEGAAGLKHRSAGRRSNRAYPEKLRRRVLGVVWEKYSGPVGERFGPTLAAEHLASDDDVGVDAETLRRWMLEGVCGAGSGGDGDNGGGASARSTLGRWCRWTEVFTDGGRSGAQKDA